MVWNHEVESKHLKIVFCYQKPKDLTVCPCYCYYYCSTIASTNPMNELKKTYKTQFWDVLAQLHDSRPFQLGKYTVWPQEFDFPGENAQFWQLDVKNEEKRSEYLFKFGFFLITRTEPIRFRPELVGKLRMGLPHLSKQLRDQNNSQKHEKHKNLYKIFSIAFCVILK